MWTLVKLEDGWIRKGDLMVGHKDRTLVVLAELRDGAPVDAVVRKHALAIAAYDDRITTTAWTKLGGYHVLRQVEENEWGKVTP